MRAVIFGVDGLSFRILEPLIERGDLPNFARLRHEGVTSELISTIPPMTPPASSSFTFPNAFKDELYKVIPDYHIDLSLEKTSPYYYVDTVLDMTEKRIQLQEHLLSEH